MLLLLHVPRATTFASNAMCSPSSVRACLLSNSGPKLLSTASVAALWLSHPWSMCHDVSMAVRENVSSNYQSFLAVLDFWSISFYNPIMLTWYYFFQYRIHRNGSPLVPGYQGHIPGYKHHGAGRTFGDATRDTCCIMSQWGDGCPQLPMRIFEQ